MAEMAWMAQQRRGRIVTWPRGRSLHSLGEWEESWVGVKGIRSRVRSRKEERKRASSEIARKQGEAEEAAEEGPETGAMMGGGPGCAMVGLWDVNVGNHAARHTLRILPLSLNSFRERGLPSGMRRLRVRACVCMVGESIS